MSSASPSATLSVALHTSPSQLEVHHIQSSPAGPRRLFVQHCAHHTIGYCDNTPGPNHSHLGALPVRCLLGQTVAICLSVCLHSNHT